MKCSLSFVWVLFGCILGIQSIHATHNRAGEITYKQTGPTSVEMTITTYTKASSTAADRDSLEVFWGDGSRQIVQRNANLTRLESNDIKINFYIASHTYPGAATYTISFLDPNRVGGILNVNYPNSIDIPFFLSTTFTLLDRQFQGFNNSAILLQPPIDIGCVNEPFIHNPNAYDADGDSLAYELVPPLQALNSPVPGYRYPDEIGTGQNNSFTINERTGEVRWDSPKLSGEYNIAILIKEYRRGFLINVIFRDMQILIKACSNKPPVIEVQEEICIIAGEKLVFPIRIDDANVNQKVKLSATGGPFIIDNPAILIGPKFFTPIPFQARLEWQTTCNHISEQYYQIVLRAVDNFNADSTGLATLKTIRIKVVGPAPQNLTSTSIDGKIRLEWDKPYACEVTENNYFQGFSVWRKIASTSYEPDTCRPGLSNSPYTRIATKIFTNINEVYFYEDEKIEKGNTYCYRVQAEFAKLTPTGNPYNKVESLPSNESCKLLSRDLPLITKVSVQKTGLNDGTIHLRWTKPLADQLDTLKNPGPYTYEIWRSDELTPFVLISSQSTPFFSPTIDTNYFDNNLNTVENQYFYYLSFYANNQKIGNSPQASSVYLSIAPTDRKNILSWTSTTPWNNITYKIFRENTQGNFEFRGETTALNFEDTGLVNGQTYCYKIESSGTYALPNIEDPIFNDSQVKCQAPIDNVPPCTPTIEVTNICDNISINIDPLSLYNEITWNNLENSCPSLASDLFGYNIYYAEKVNDSFTLIATRSKSDGLIYLHYPENGLLGCYQVTAIDSLLNESERSNKVCVDNCPFYELPNTFTPNDDGKNDVFKPRVNLFIFEVDFKVFNQWGNLVFETTDANINWNGQTNSGNKLADGTYFYTCKVFENRVTGVTQADKSINGFIHIIRN